MTTDTRNKQVAVKVMIGGKEVTIGGMCKALRHDSSEYVHNARICDNGCEYLQKASTGSTER